MTGATTLGWFARHELTLAWRDWVQMMSGGYTVRERALVAGTLAFVGGLHWLAYEILEPVLAGGVTLDKPTLVIVAAVLLSAFSMLLSQAIEQVTRVFYARSDLDLILSSPTAAHHLFSVRILAVAVTGAAMTSLLATPFVNMAVAIDGARWLAAYGVLAAMSMIATAIAVGLSIALFGAFGPKKTRLIAQIIAAVVGASLLIGLQVTAILTYGDLSRWNVLTSSTFVAAMPDADSFFWTLARASLGDINASVAVLLAAIASLTAAILMYAPQFGAQAIAAANAIESDESPRASRPPFKPGSQAEMLRRKEWMLLARDPWLVSQSLMQLLYLLPPALLLWRDIGQEAGAPLILAPVLVMAFGQLAGGLSWLAISGEDAPDLMHSAPLTPFALLRAKIEAVLGVVALIAAPLMLAMALSSPVAALVATAGTAASATSAVAIQLWFKSAAKRSQFRRRQTASRIATIAEAFSSILWAAATGFAVAAHLAAAAVAAILAVSALAAARWLRPQKGD